MGRKRDRFWEFVKEKNGRFICNFCGRVYAGGASRIKPHLAGVKGNDIDICKNVPQSVREEAFLAIRGPNKKVKSTPTPSDAKESTTTSTSISEIKEVGLQSKDEYTAEVIFDDVVEGLQAKLILLITQQIVPEWDFKLELLHTLVSLTKIQGVLHDAEKRQASEFVRNWVVEFRGVACEAEVVLDECDYEILQWKVQTQNQMNERVPGPSLSNMSTKIKTINQSLDRIQNGVAGFGLRMEFVISKPKPDSEVVGRGYDVSTIVNLLISANNQEVITVLPIVGMSGLGKTTLAKLVCNHSLVKKHFDVLSWICVTDNFNVGWILREILKSLGRVLPGLKGEYVILQNLKKILWGKKYLLILDDVWDVDPLKWGTIRNLLIGINSNFGNSIVVTTHSEHVAKAMETLPRHYLEKLSKDECWSIFKERAFENEGIPLSPSLEAIGREIAKRCGGVPLFARVLGGIMLFKEATNEWLSTLNDKIQDLLDDGNGFFPVLKLSFDYLPTPFLKQCFAFCAIFPKHYTMEKEELIQFWMAEGFLQPPHGSDLLMEDIGNMYFNIFLATSLLQDVEKDVYGNVNKCKMHYLLHHLALSMSKSETLIIERDFVDDISEVRHLFIQSNGQTLPRLLFPRDGVTKLRTLSLETSMSGIALSNFKFLRALKLFGDNITELPDSIDWLIHLRLLRISHTVIKALPMSITKLYNLQTLRIEYCHSLKELPEDIRNLINLRHLYIHHEDIKRTPKGIGQLASLQTLSFFVVDLDAGCGIKELGCLNYLKGELNIYNLEHVRNKDEAKSANLLMEKFYKLGFYWSNHSHREKEDNHHNDEEVLEGLLPHRCLKSLTIFGFGGENFPSWMLTSRDSMDSLALFDNLIEIDLSFCWKCEVVPTLGHLPCLRVLKIREMGNVRHIGIEFYRKDNDVSYKETLFPVLRRFELMSMHKLEVWEDALELVGLLFPCLEELIIEECNKLTSAPCHFPSLKKLRVSNLNSTAFENISSKLVTLLFLWICNVSKLPFLPGKLLHNNTNLISLHIEKCPELECISPHLSVWAFCTSLRSLKIEDCEKLRTLPNKLHSLHSLARLEVQRCPNLRSFPSVQGAASLLILRIRECTNLILIPDLQELHSLVELQISYCGSLMYLPKGLDKLTRLKDLSIGGFCDKLDTFPNLNFQAWNAQLEWLSLYGWAEIDLPNGIQCCTALRKLYIKKFDGMVGLPEWLGNLSSLQKLSLKNCKNLMYLPQAMKRLTKLEWLCIHCCPELSKRCAMESGIDWSKIAHIRNIKIDNEVIKGEAV